MAQFRYGGQGFALQQQTGGSTLASNYWGNTAIKNNPFVAVNDLIGDLQVNHVNKVLSRNVNPYDGLTANQKLQQLGLINDYTLGELDNFTKSYNTEAANIIQARQRASDFNAEPVLAQAALIESLGDPRQIQAFSNKLSRYVNTQIASGAMTPETAQKLYKNYNKAAQERANIANTYAQTRQTNANAYGKELSNIDYATEQANLANLARIVNHGAKIGVPVNDFNSGMIAGTHLGLSQFEIAAALSAVNVARYKAQYGDFFKNLGEASVGAFTSIPNYNIPSGTPTAYAGGATTTPPTVPNAQSGLGTPSVVDANALQNGSTTQTGSGVQTGQQGSTQQQQVANSSGQTGQLTSGSGTPPNVTTGTPNVDGSTPSTTLAPDNTNNTPTNATNITSTGTTPTPTPSPSPSPTNSDAVTTSQLLQQADGTPTPTTTTENKSNNLEAASNQVNVNNGNAVIETRKDGSKYINAGDNVIFDPETGSFVFSEKIPKDQVNIFEIQKANENLMDINRRTGGRLSQFVTFGKDASGQYAILPTPEVQKLLDSGDPEVIAQYGALRDAVYNAVGGLFSKENMPAGYNLLQAVFGSGQESKAAGARGLQASIKNSRNKALSENLDKNIASRLGVGGNIDTISEITKALTPLYNQGQSSNGLQQNMSFVQNAVKSNPQALGTATNIAVDQANNELGSIKKDIDTANSYYSNIDALTKYMDESVKVGGSIVNGLEVLFNSEDPIHQAIANTYIKNGLVIPNNSKINNADDAQDWLEFTQGSTQEVTTALQKAANILESEYNISPEQAQSIVIFSGFTPDRTALNAVITISSETNSPLYVNMEQAHKLAAIYESTTSPEGQVVFNNGKTALKNAQDSVNNFTAAGEALKKNAAAYANILNELNALGIPVREQVNKDNTTSYFIDENSMTNNGLNILLTNKGLSTKDSVTNYYKSLRLYLASYGELVKAVAPVVQQVTLDNARNEVLDNGKSLKLSILDSSNHIGKRNTSNSYYVVTPSPTSIPTVAYPDVSDNNASVSDASLKDALSGFNSSVSAQDLRDISFNNQNSKSTQWFQTAAKQGNSDAQYNLGFMYLHGFGGLPKDITLAKQWFKAASDQGHPYAQNALKNMSNSTNIGDLSKESQGTGTDIVNQIFSDNTATSSQTSNTNSLKESPQLNYDNINNKDSVDAKTLVEGNSSTSTIQQTLEDKQLNTESTFNKGKALVENPNSSPEDIAKGVKLIEDEANSGNAEAQYYLASMYENEQGVEQSNTKWDTKVSPPIDAESLKKDANNNVPSTPTPVNQNPPTTQDQSKAQNALKNKGTGTDIVNQIFSDNTDNNTRLQQETKDTPLVNANNLKDGTNNNNVATTSKLEEQPTIDQSTNTKIIFEKVTPTQLKEQEQMIKQEELTPVEQEFLNQNPEYKRDIVYGMFIKGSELLENNNASPEDIAKGIAFMKAAADRGYARAQHNLGYRYRYGIGVEQDLKQALTYYQAGADQGDYFARFSLGMLYKDMQDYKQAEKWLKLAADKQNFPPAQQQLGIMYENGEGVPQDYKQAAKYYLAAAKQSDKESQRNLGILYYDGKGVEQDYTQAFKWFSEAADMNDEASQYFVAQMYYHGKGTEQDYTQAFKWYQAAAEHGNVDSLTMLGIMYYKGQSVEQNMDKAIHYWEIAARFGDEAAQSFIATLISNKMI